VNRRFGIRVRVIPQAMKLNPAFLKMVYTDLLNAKKTREINVREALDVF
jgi:hypothetical protein